MLGEPAGEPGIMGSQVHHSPPCLMNPIYLLAECRTGEAEEASQGASPERAGWAGGMVEVKAVL